MLIALYKHVCYNKGNVTIALTLGEELERKRTIGRNSEQYNRKGKRMVRKYQNKNNKHKLLNGTISTCIIAGLVCMSAISDDYKGYIVNAIGLGLLGIAILLERAERKFYGNN